MKQTPSFPPRRSLRVHEFDYSQPGAYFLTIVTHERKQLFGQIVNGDVVLNEVGKMVEEVWIAIPKHFKNIELGEFVIMPDHIHGIISITVEATHAMPAQDGFVVESTQCAASPCGMCRLYPGYPKALFPVRSEQSLVHSNPRHQRDFVRFPTIRKNIYGSGIIMNVSSGTNGITRQSTITSLLIQ